MVANALIQVEGLRKGFPVNEGTMFAPRRTWLWAVDGISFTVSAGETLGVVGESGCGKTTTAMMLLALEQPTEGRILYDGHDLAKLDREAFRRYRASVQAVLQDPWSSLSPRRRTRDIIAEPLLVQKKLSRAERLERVNELLQEVGLRPAHANLFPHEFSGGQRQRICIARALSVDPRLVVLDEPVSALDVSVQAQIINLLKDMQERTGVSYLLISHSLTTVRYLCTRVVVMYLGQIVEQAAADALFKEPLHPYTQALMAAGKPLPPGDDGLVNVEGEVPSPTAMPPGCRFHTRCPHAFARCREDQPALREVAPGRQVRCHLFDA